VIPLPEPKITGGVSVEEAIAGRRSVREYADTPLELSELSQLLWAAQGVTDAEGHRTAPSAGALYPLGLYAATAAGLSRYIAAAHALEHVSSRDLRADLAEAALGQQEVAQAPCVLILTAEAARTTRKYGERGVRYVHIEIGHAAQNVLLAAAALGLAAYPVGAFDDARLAELLRLGRGEAALYLVPVGAPPVATRSRS
jgi:SagB-type dehydrogenase family enzyme